MGVIRREYRQRYLRHLKLYRLLLRVRQEKERYELNQKKKTKKTFKYLGNPFSFIPVMRPNGGVDSEDPSVYDYKIPPETFQELLKIIEDYLMKGSQFGKGKFIVPEVKLAVTLRFLISGESMQTICAHGQITSSTFSKIIRNTCKAIWDVLGKQVLCPPDEETYKQIADDFYRKYDVPNCVGCIGGKNILIQAANIPGMNSIIHKKYRCIVAIAACDTDYIFRHVDISPAGGQSTFKSFASSSFGQSVLKQTLPMPTDIVLNDITIPSVFITENPFPLKPKMLNICRNKDLSPMQKFFNSKIINASTLTENTFGIMGARWAVYSRPINASIETIECIIKATFCLHNFFQMRSNQQKKSGNCDNLYCPDSMVDREDADGNCVRGLWKKTYMVAIQPITRQGNRRYSSESFLMKEQFMKYYAKNAPESQNGHVPNL